MVLKTKPCLIVPKCLAAGRRHKPDALWETRGAAIKFLARHCPSQASILFSQKFHQKIQISSAAVSMTYLGGISCLWWIRKYFLSQHSSLKYACPVAQGVYTLYHILSSSLCPITIHVCSNLTITTIHYYIKHRTSTSCQGHCPLIIFKLFSLTCWSKRPLTKPSPSCCWNPISTLGSKHQETSMKPTQHFSIDSSKKFKSRRA